MIKEKNIIAVFAKPPIPGKTKSRLAKDIGNEKAAEISETMLKYIIKEAEFVRDTQTVIFYPPEFNKDDFKKALPDFKDYLLQEGGNLGERMANAFYLLFNKYRCDKVIIVGGDCVTNTTDIFNDIFAYLAENQVVIHPAVDGGYVMIAQSVYNKKEVFQNIEWGTDSVMSKTRKKLIESQIKYFEMQESFDIDTLEDLNNHSKQLQELHLKLL